MFLDALSYPVRRGGWLMILLGAVFSVILDFAQRAPFVGLIAAIFSAGYFGAFYLDIVSTTMTGRDEVPEWPSISSFIADILAPFFRLVVLVLVSFLPALVILFTTDEEAFGDVKSVGIVSLFIAAVAYGALYFPMAVLALQAFGGLGAALPHVVFPAIFRALPGYLLTVIALVVGFIAAGFAQDFTKDIPYVGWFLTTVVALYSLMFQARLIGLVYRAKSDKLGWE